MVRPPPIVTSKPPQNVNRGYGPEFNIVTLMFWASHQIFILIGLMNSIPEI